VKLKINLNVTFDVQEIEVRNVVNTIVHLARLLRDKRVPESDIQKAKHVTALAKLCNRITKAPVHYEVKRAPDELLSRQYPTILRTLARPTPTLALAMALSQASGTFSETRLRDLKSVDSSDGQKYLPFADKNAKENLRSSMADAMGYYSGMWTADEAQCVLNCLFSPASFLEQASKFSVAAKLLMRCPDTAKFLVATVCEAFDVNLGDLAVEFIDTQHRLDTERKSRQNKARAANRKEELAFAAKRNKDIDEELVKAIRLVESRGMTINKKRPS